MPKEKDEAVSELAVATAEADFTLAPEPFALFEAWFAEAERAEVNDPNAMTLATVDGNGMPNARIVLMKGLDEPARGADRGFVFYTNTSSAKGFELLGHPRAALLFHWKGLRRQIRIRGTVALVSPDEADAYYVSRPRGSRIGAWASDQSKPLADRAMLEQAVATYDAKFGEGDIPRPAHWSGFRVTPLEIEFWHDRPFRLHDRVIFARALRNEPWERTRLFP